MFRSSRALELTCSLPNRNRGRARRRGAAHPRILARTTSRCLSSCLRLQPHPPCNRRRTSSRLQPWSSTLEDRLKPPCTYCLSWTVDGRPHRFSTARPPLPKVDKPAPGAPSLRRYATVPQKDTFVALSQHLTTLVLSICYPHLQPQMKVVSSREFGDGEALLFRSRQSSTLPLSRTRFAPTRLLISANMLLPNDL